MLKRVRWMGVGAAAGVGASAWAQRRWRRTLRAHPSIRSGADVAAAARRLRSDVREAVSDGRRAMSEREAELRADLSGPRPATPPPGRPTDHLRVVDATSSEPRPARHRSTAIEPGPARTGDADTPPSGRTPPGGPPSGAGTGHPSHGGLPDAAPAARSVVRRLRPGRPPRT